MTREVRSHDGMGNNAKYPHWGKAGQPLIRLIPSAYQDGISVPARNGTTNPRKISNLMCSEIRTITNAEGLSDFVWAWGQFLDHEIGLSPEFEHNSPHKIETDISLDDPVLPGGKIEITRSLALISKGKSWEQTNALSSYIDGANVYGADPVRANSLRELSGGRLRSSGQENELLPRNTDGADNAPTSHDPRFFLAGDVRANEHSVLTSMHTLFMREHNRRCEQISANHKDLPKDKAARDEEIYQQARRYVIGLMQVITYQEFLPILLGRGALPDYGGYKPEVNASITNIFSTACYRLGHSMLSDLLVLGDGSQMFLRDAFFKPELVADNGIELFLGGLVIQRMQEVDLQIIDSVRNFLFQLPGSMGNTLGDLAARNIMRGRDHGLPDFNTCRSKLGLKPYTHFEEISSSEMTVHNLKLSYNDNVNQIDPWIGGLAEDHIPGAIVGEFNYAVIREQFLALRDGDRFWYENDPALLQDLSAVGEALNSMKNTTLATVIMRNSLIAGLPHSVFQATNIAL